MMLLLFGATGMAGQGALRECVLADHVIEVAIDDFGDGYASRPCRKLSVVACL